MFCNSRDRDGHYALIVDENGIIDNSTAISVGFIPWDNIGEISVSKVLFAQFIEVELLNEEQIIPSLPSYKKVFISINKAFGYNPVSIHLTGTGESTGTVFIKILEYRNSLK